MANKHGHEQHPRLYGGRSPRTAGDIMQSVFVPSAHCWQFGNRQNGLGIAPICWVDVAKLDWTLGDWRIFPGMNCSNCLWTTICGFWRGANWVATSDQLAVLHGMRAVSHPDGSQNTPTRVLVGGQSESADQLEANHMFWGFIAHSRSGAQSRQ